MLNLPATLTQTQAKECLDQLLQGIQRAAEPEVVVSGSQLSRFDTSALAVLLAVRRECARAGKHFAVQALPQRLRDLAALYGIERLLPGV